MTDLDIPTRLLNGARIIGSIWKDAAEPKHCGWNFCNCFSPRSKWCEAKRQFYVMLTKAGRDPYTGDFAVIESMTLAEADATGVVVEVAVPVGKIRVGGGGAIGWADLGKLAGDPQGASSIFQVLSTFKFSSVLQIKEPVGGKEEATVDKHDAQSGDAAGVGAPQVQA